MKTRILSILFLTLCLALCLASCGETPEEPHTHTEGEWIIDVEATKTTDGRRHKECTVCGETIKEEVIVAGSIGLAYEVNSDGQTCTITGIGICTDTEVFIPRVINGYTVTSIGDDAFRDCTGLTSITIPDSVTSIGTFAFSGCTSLTSITILDSVTEIGARAFYNCTSLTSVTIGNGVTSIGERAFFECTSLNAVYITDIATWCGISFDDYYANPLCYAKNLYLGGELVTDLVIPNGVTSIGNYAFENCANINSVTIPDSVTSIGEDAFYNCTSLQYNQYDNANYLGNENNPYLVLVKATDRSIASSIASCNIHKDTRVIYGEAFQSCIRLTSITIPDSVTSIGWRAFHGCYSLTSVTIGSGVTSIGDYAFCRCDSLTSITIPDSVTSIGDYAFSYSDSLTSVTIGNSVTSIGERAFLECTSLTSITYTGTMAQWKAISKATGWNDWTPAFTVYCTDGNLGKHD